MIIYLLYYVFVCYLFIISRRGRAVCACVSFPLLSHDIACWKVCVCVCVSVFDLDVDRLVEAIHLIQQLEKDPLHLAVRTLGARGALSWCVRALWGAGQGVVKASCVRNKIK